MDVWQLLLFVAATVLALRSLTGLATNHHRRYLAELRAADEARRRAEKAKAKAAAAKAISAKVASDKAKDKQTAAAPPK